MNLFAIASLTLSVACFLLAGLIFAYSRIRLHRIWGMFNVAVAIFGLGTFFVGISKTYQTAFLSWQIAFFGIAYIATFFYHVVHEFCQLSNKKTLYFVYAHGILFSLFAILTNLIVNSLKFVYGQFYYYIADVWFNSFFFVWIVIVSIAFAHLYLYMKKTSGLKAIQGKYLFFGMLLGFSSGATTSIPSWGINIYPGWHVLICVYAGISTYAILRYNIMNIKVAFSRLSIFILVYSVVLGIPFGGLVWGKSWLMQVFGENWYWPPMLSLLVLATAGPFIYLYFQQRAEKRILQEEHRTQELLTQASYGMTSVRHMIQLSKLIIDMLSKILKIQKVQLFILNKEARTYEMKASLDDTENPLSINGETALVTELMRRKYPTTYDEIKFKAESNHSIHYKGVLAQMEQFSCRVVVPIVFESSLLGFIVLSDHKENEIYSNELLNVLAVFGNQVALAMKNCHFLEAEAKRWEDESLMERRRSLDHLVASMAHEIDNPMAIILGNAGFGREILDGGRFFVSDEVKKELNHIFDEIAEAQGRVSGMVKAIEKYSKKAPGELTPMKITEAEAGYWKLSGKSFGLEHIKYARDVDDHLPCILGDEIQLEEVLVNFANNARYALRGAEMKEVRLKIFQKNEDWIRIEFFDTGSGIEKKLLKDIFLPYVTTKGSAEGTGMGLHHVRRIIDLHKGFIWAESEGKGKGSAMIVELPIYKGEIKDHNFASDNKAF